MSLALVPCVLLTIAAIAIAGKRVYVLALRAPVAAAPLTAALTRQIARGDHARAIALCRELDPAWAAECAEACMQASNERAPLQPVVEELRVTYAQRAGQGLEALRALSRMSFPLALGTAIVTMSGAFAAAEVAQVEQALSTALQALIVAVTTAVFCRVSAAIVSRQGALRMREITVVCRGMMEALAEGTRSEPTQA